MDKEIKDYIDSKFSFLAKLLNVCEHCNSGQYVYNGCASYPQPMNCNNCGISKQYNNFILTPQPTATVSKPINTKKDENDDMTFGLFGLFD